MSTVADELARRLAKFDVGFGQWYRRCPPRAVKRARDPSCCRRMSQPLVCVSDRRRPCSAPGNPGSPSHGGL